MDFFKLLPRPEQLKKKVAEVLGPPVQHNKDDSASGITPALIEFVTSLCEHPETFVDFPMDGARVRSQLSETQAAHAVAILSAAPALETLRYKIVPRTMSDQKFWMVYFLVVRNYLKDIPAFEEALENSSDCDLEGVLEDDVVLEQVRAPVAPADSAVGPERTQPYAGGGQPPTQPSDGMGDVARNSDQPSSDTRPPTTGTSAAAAGGSADPLAGDFAAFGDFLERHDSQ